MKKILVICGTGIATSTIIIEKVKAWLEKEQLNEQVELHQGNVHDAINKGNEYDFMISATFVPGGLQEKAIDGVPLLAGTGETEVYESIKSRLI
ncbi:MAG TPA: PTS galactitol transporter subunit IIB [Lentibacillus sp.]|uniref:PTS galactitol transporter subunit IIB n=1 Tax=Lentibacillus sp. TaxID=1925746 RepID=UPI002B4AF58B|nr:PTS galactitol transporter subunit IIB [Lentibacillus sp.]HLR62538.1 PTS galactitol transporter subunit IIB [Lentibacillus sp.]